MTTSVVTGGGRGLGRGIALALADAGHDLVLGWCRDARAVEETAADARASGSKVETVQGDVADPSTSKAFVEAALASTGRLDVWVNNAGVSLIATVAETPMVDMERMLAVNVTGTMLGIQAAAHAMRDAGEGGRIVNLASDAGLQGFPYLGAYAATKFAVVGLTQTAALELAPDRITVNAVCPGTAETAMNRAEWNTETALTGRSVDEVRAAYCDAIPLGRFCTPEDVGALVSYLAGPAASFVTGQSVCVNGGTVLH